MRINNKLINISLLLLTTIWLSRYFFLDQIPNVDLDAQLAAGERLWQNFKTSGNFQFYDPFWFGGYPAFYFYGWLAHFLAGSFYELLNIFSDLDFQYSARSFLLLNLIILPFNLYLLSQKLYQDDFPQKSPSIYLALISGTLSFWFLNISDASSGAGLAAALHSGMFSQAIAWNIIILTALILLCSAGKLGIRNLISHTVLAAALILCHPLTAAFYFIISPIYYLLRFKTLLFPLISLVLASILTVPWWINFFRYSEYLVPEKNHSAKHFFEILLGLDSPNGISSLLYNPVIFNFSYLLILFSILSLIIYRHKSALLWILTLLLFSLSASQLSSLSQFGFAVHINRFAPLAALLSLPALSASLCGFIDKHKTTAAQMLISGLIFLAFISTAFNPAAEYKYIATTESKTRYNNEMELLKIIEQLPAPKRIFQEYFNDYFIFNFVSPHYITAGLNRLNIETLNGLYIQSSLANRQAAEAAALLGLDFYGTFIKKDKDIAAGIKRLEELGTTHLILTNPNVIKSLKYDHNLNFKDFGPYSLFKLNNPANIITCLSGACINKPKAVALWQAGYKTLELTNLTPDSGYFINYNYFPTLTCQGCVASQGDFEKIIIKNNDHTAHLKFK